MADPKPLVLLADSQLLFWSDEHGRRFLARLLALAGEGATRAAYLGASNGDQPEFFELFRAALRDLGEVDCRHVPAEPTAEDLAFLSRAEFVLLAGGDPLLGLRAFQAHGVDRLLAERYTAGALLAGVSAGAVQLGLGWRPADGAGSGHEPMLALAPFVVDAHDEPDWAPLRALVEAGGPAWRGIGVPAGGGLLLHADLSLEPVRRASTVFEWRGTQVTPALIAPTGEDESAAGAV